MTIKEREILLHEELKRIVGLTIKEYSPEKIILFGSLAINKIHPYSDVDLMIVKYTNRRFIDRLHDIHLMTQPKVGVNFIVYTPSEFEQLKAENRYFLTKEILAKGKVLYEKQ